MQPEERTFRSTHSCMQDRASAKGASSAGSLSLHCEPGFSMVELLVVVAIILIVAAIAIPTMSTTMDAYRIRGSMTSISGLVQRARVQAIKQDATQEIHFATVSGRVVVFVTTASDTNTKPVVGDANLSEQFWLPAQFSIPGAPTGGTPTTLTSTIMWGTSTAVGNINVPIYFNSRGIACVPNAGGVCTATSGFIYYYQYQTGTKTTRWAATSVSPAGRIESWFWNGGSWGN